MFQKHATLMRSLPLFLLLIFAVACSSNQPGEPGATQSGAGPEAIPTATITPLSPMDLPATPTTPPSPCEGVAGDIEVQNLVGPSDAVGLEPKSVGYVPFSVTSGEPPYLLQGLGSINYSDILIEEWGTYQVTMEMQLTLEGECIEGTGSPQLEGILGMSGSQLVEVTSEGFSGEYPWVGNQDFDLVFPLEEGATIQGEGYTFVLHLDG